jgi:hypothetical protein
MEVAMRRQLTICSGWMAKASLLFLLIATLEGCGGSKPGGTVNGKVSYKGESVPAGMVTFFGSTADRVASASIAKDGTYTASGVPVGKVTVTVTTPMPGPTEEQIKKNGFLKRKNIKASTDKVVSVPAKFANAATSHLSLTVSEGSQPYDIELK